MQTQLVPSANLVTPQDCDKMRRLSVTGWLRTHDTRLLDPALRFDLDSARVLVAQALEGRVSQQIGAAILGPRELLVADRLALAEFVFRDTKRRTATQTMAVWLAQPLALDWTTRLYYASWYAFLTSQHLAGWLAWQEQGIVPATALRRTRERLMQDAIGVLTRLELVEFVKHLDALAAEW
jgi:hypothetical protein